jgi:hypothetical protein
MERLGTLISKLKEQFDQQAGADKLMVTAQLILSELQQNQSKTPSAFGKVSVVMPAMHQPSEPTVAINFIEPKAHKNIPSKKEEKTGWLFDADEIIPTLAHQPPLPVKEVNEAAEHKKESLNDILKEDKTELASALHATPVKDLKKAIGVNDRYLFLNELFRGDESMYERSIKTLNNFSIYPEAEYWIQRELKVKLGWKENNETVQLFDQIVRRRFS